MGSCTRLLAGVLSLALLAGCSSKPVIVEPAPAPPPVEAEPAPPAKPAPVQARILAVGDLLMHTPLVYASALPNEEWDFKPLFEPVRPWLQGADLTVANLETTLTGSDYPWSGYPSFNTPPEFARDIKAVGFDAVTHANNHTLDYDQPGVNKTIEALDRYGLHRVGAARSPEEAERIPVISVKPGISLALLAYTNSTNWVPLPNPWTVNLMDPDRITADIRRARQMPGVDLVAVALHFGDEYARTPNALQEEIVQLSLTAGADIILGCHPHVIQPIEVRQVRDEFGRDLPRAVIFSMGNFISNQVGLHREAGLMFLVDVIKEDNVTRIQQVSFLPTWVHGYKENGTRKYRVVAVEKAMRDYERESDSLITAADYARLREVWADTTVQAVGSQEVVLLGVDQPFALAGAR